MRALLSGSLENIQLLIIGGVVAFISALIIVKWFVGFLQKTLSRHLVGIGSLSPLYYFSSVNPNLTISFALVCVFCPWQ